MSAPRALVRTLGVRDYAATWQAMQDFTAARVATTPDEIWLLEHPPVYTLGRNAKHRPAATTIPVVACDRGGDITYHGPGQSVLYTLLDLARLQTGVKSLVHALEQAAIDFLLEQGIVGERRAGAPGVYVAGEKIAALGLRVRHGCSYHGLAFNYAMDLTPFANIAPCGYPGLPVTDLQALIRASAGTDLALDGTTVGARLGAHFLRNMGYNRAQIIAENSDVAPN